MNNRIIPVQILKSRLKHIMNELLNRDFEDQSSYICHYDYVHEEGMSDMLIQ